MNKMKLIPRIKDNARKYQKGGYVVKSGDSLSKIALGNNTTVELLK